MGGYQLNSFHLDNITSPDLDKRLYNCERVISMAIRAYNHADNALSEQAVIYEDVSIDHAEFPKAHGYNFNYLFNQGKID